MAPLAQWAIQILSGSLYAKNYISLIGTQWQVKPQAKDNLATPLVDSIGVGAIANLNGWTNLVVGPFDNGSIGYKHRDYYGNWSPKDGYQNIGGSIKGPPVAVRLGNSPQDFFAVGRDNHLWHKAVNRTYSWLPSQLEWRDLGGNLSSNYPLTAVGGEWKHVDVFGVREENDGSKSLWRKSWDGSNWLPSEHDLEQLTGSFSTAPAVTSRKPEELSLFIVDVNKNFLYRRYSYNDRSWIAWETLGTRFRSAPAALAISADRCDVFGIKEDGTLNHRAYVEGQGWLEWENFGGNFDEIVSVGKLLPDSLLLVTRKADGTYDGLLYRWDRPVNENVWDSLGGAFASRPAVTGDWPRKTEIFGIGLDGALLYKNFQDGNWFPARREWTTLAKGPNSSGK